jgi:hypothetical protein
MFKTIAGKLRRLGTMGRPTAAEVENPQGPTISPRVSSEHAADSHGGFLRRTFSSHRIGDERPDEEPAPRRSTLPHRAAATSAALASGSSSAGAEAEHLQADANIEPSQLVTDRTLAFIEKIKAPQQPDLPGSTTPEATSGGERDVAFVSSDGELATRHFCASPASVVPELKAFLSDLGVSENQLQQAVLLENWQIFRRIHDNGDGSQIAKHIGVNINGFIEKMIKPRGAYTNYITISEIDTLRSHHDAIFTSLKSASGRNIIKRLESELRKVEKEYQSKLAGHVKTSYQTVIPKHVRSRISEFTDDTLKIHIGRGLVSELETPTIEGDQSRHYKSEPVNVGVLSKTSGWSSTLQDLGYPEDLDVYGNDLYEQWKKFVSLHGPLTIEVIHAAPAHFMFYMLENILNDSEGTKAPALSRKPLGTHFNAALDNAALKLPANGPQTPNLIGAFASAQFTGLSVQRQLAKDSASRPQTPSSAPAESPVDSQLPASSPELSVQHPSSASFQAPAAMGQAPAHAFSVHWETGDDEDQAQSASDLGSHGNSSTAPAAAGPDRPPTTPEALSDTVTRAAPDIDTETSTESDTETPQSDPASLPTDPPPVPVHSSVDLEPTASQQGYSVHSGRSSRDGEPRTTTNGSTSGSDLPPAQPSGYADRSATAAVSTAKTAPAASFEEMQTFWKTQGTRGETGSLQEPTAKSETPNRPLPKPPTAPPNQPPAP